MGNRLSKIYTKSGDDGTTGLGDGTRVKKDSLRVEAYGTIDEANSVIGIILSSDVLSEKIRHCLTTIQHDLFELSSELCIPGHKIIQQSFIDRLEKDLDEFNGTLPALKEFILPGGNEPATYTHLARTIVRRAERRIISLNGKEEVRDEILSYVNRLSDLLFVIARVIARSNEQKEVLWNRDRI